eukprot:Sspe_Gene.102616::Locus_78491_Transcript_2_3_Confidence_0.556_Length_533::g.102616::m.102616
MAAQQQEHAGGEWVWCDEIGDYKWVDHTEDHASTREPEQEERGGGNNWEGEGRWVWDDGVNDWVWEEGAVEEEGNYEEEGEAAPGAWVCCEYVNERRSITGVERQEVGLGVGRNGLA